MSVIRHICDIVGNPFLRRRRRMSNHIRCCVRAVGHHAIERLSEHDFTKAEAFMQNRASINGVVSATLVHRYDTTGGDEARVSIEVSLDGVIGVCSPTAEQPWLHLGNNKDIVKKDLDWMSTYTRRVDLSISDM